jgi:hypothetical protein
MIHIPVPFRRRHWPVRFAVAVLVGSVVVSGVGKAQDTGDILAAARSAVASGNVEKSRQLGFSNAKFPFSETAREGILVGFDCGVGKFGSGETVYAFRPIYRTPEGNTFFKEFGIFADVREGNKTIKTKVLRTVSLRANPGYAVGAMTMRTGLNIDGLSLTYMRIVGNQLDPKQSYVSEWVGDRKGGGENRIEGTGNPVVGVFGTLSDTRHAQALGLIYARGLAKPVVVDPIKPDPVRTDPLKPDPLKMDPIKPPDLPATVREKPARETGAAKRETAPEVTEKPPFHLTKRPVIPDTVSESRSDAELPTAIPLIAFGSVGITGVFVGLIFLRHGKGAAGQQATERNPIQIDVLESPTEPAPTLKPADRDAIRAADGPAKPITAPKLESIWETKTEPKPALPPTPESSRATADGMPLLELDDDSPAKPQAAPVALTAPRVTFFTGRMVTKATQPLYRVYMIGDEMLFLYAGPGEGNSAVNKGQALGGIIGGMIGKAVSAEMQERTRVRQRELDSADVAQLREIAGRDDNFRATAGDFTSISIEAVGFWNSLTVGPDCAAVLQFTHRGRGNYTVALLSLDDVRIAAEALPAALGTGVQVNVVWSDASLKYVKK